MGNQQPEKSEPPRDCNGTDLTRLIVQRVVDRFERWEANFNRYRRMMRRRL